MLVTCRQMQEAEERFFAAGGSAAALMEKAGLCIARVVRQFFPRPGTLVLYLGSGNNAGDALVAARWLLRDGWHVYGRLAMPVERMKELPRHHLNDLQSLAILDEAPTGNGFEPGPVVLLDGLLGIGSQGELRPHLRTLAAEMNTLRQCIHASTFAMDIPSGLDGDTGQPLPDAVIADVTVAVGQIKTGLVADAATGHIGRLAFVPLDELETCEGDANASAITPGLLRSWLPRRDFEMHKGQAGRVGILAGSCGFLGAARLACNGALRAGAGLVTLLVKEEAYSMLARTLPPEIMVKPVQDYRQALDMRFDALAIGPGLGFESETEVLELMSLAIIPAVIDADALTMVAKQGLEALRSRAGQRLLTPHPGEMERLVSAHPEWKSLGRRALTEAFASEMAQHTVLFKGARTVIATPGQPTLFNTTGHPGMATGGMGDVLTGVCAALIGQGWALHHAAAFGAWLCGRAAEIAAQRRAQESVLPTDVVSEMGAAWLELREGAAC